MPSRASTALSVLIGALRPSTASALPAARSGLLLGRRAVGENRHVLAIVAAMRAYRVGPLQLAAILAFDIGHRRQGVMGPAHVAARLRNLLLGNCHDDLPNRGALALRETGRSPRELRQ